MIFTLTIHPPYNVLLFIHNNDTHHQETSAKVLFYNQIQTLKSI